MKLMMLLAALTGAAPSDNPASAQQNGDTLRKRWAARFAQNNPPAVSPGQAIAYGSDPLQTLDFWRAKDGGKKTEARAPLVVFVHGGGWKYGDKSNETGRWKIRHFSNAGYGFASINYRLVPDATVEQQAADVAAALRALLDRADPLGIDRGRVVLMGHSAGAQLVALVGTDERYLHSAGLSFADIAGVAAIDGAAYDIVEQMADARPMMHAIYEEAFGSDAMRQRLLSPTAQAGTPNAAEFLLLHVQRPDGIHQTQELGRALQAGGSAVEVTSVAGVGIVGHAEINRRLGDPTYPATAIVDAWLKRVVGS